MLTGAAFGCFACADFGLSAEARPLLLSSSHVFFICGVIYQTLFSLRDLSYYVCFNKSATKAVIYRDDCAALSSLYTELVIGGTCFSNKSGCNGWQRGLGNLYGYHGGVEVSVC